MRTPAAVGGCVEVELPEAVAELSERSRTEVSLAAHGPNDVGIAWRPLSDPTYAVENRPVTPSAAEVRWMVVGRSGPPAAAHHRRTIAHELAMTTGVGPWPLAGNGMKASVLAGHALFAWIEDDGIHGALGGDSEATRLGPSGGWPLLAFRPSRRASADDASRATELLAFDSSPRVSAFLLRCR